MISKRVQLEWVYFDNSRPGSTDELVASGILLGSLILKEDVRLRIGA